MRGLEDQRFIHSELNMWASPTNISSTLTESVDIGDETDTGPKEDEFPAPTKDEIYIISVIPISRQEE